MKRSKPTEKLVIKAGKPIIGHQPHITGTGIHKDRRTKRQRTRQAKTRQAIEADTQ